MTRERMQIVDFNRGEEAPGNFGVITFGPDAFEINADVGVSGDRDDGNTGRVREVEFYPRAEFRAEVRLAKLVVCKGYFAGVCPEIAPQNVTQHSARHNESLLIARESKS